MQEKDLMSATDPEWDKEFVFHPVNPETKFYSFDITIKKEKDRLFYQAKQFGWSQKSVRASTTQTKRRMFFINTKLCEEQSEVAQSEVAWTNS